MAHLGFPARCFAVVVASALGWTGCEFASTAPPDAAPPDAPPPDLRLADSAPPGDAATPADQGQPPPDVRPDGAAPDLRADAPVAPMDTAPADLPRADVRPPDTAGGDPEPGKLAGMTRLHNELRAKLSLPPLVWDPAVAAIAQAYADGCRFQHSGRDGLGENLAANAPPGNTAAQAFKTWADEQVFYDYASNTCRSGEQCGHYTQVVWRNTTKVGCGVTSCMTGSPFTGFPRWELWVCNYAPPGNFSGQRPY